MRLLLCCCLSLLCQLPPERSTCTSLSGVSARLPDAVRRTGELEERHSYDTVVPMCPVESQQSIGMSRQERLGLSCSSSVAPVAPPPAVQSCSTRPPSRPPCAPCHGLRIVTAAVYMDPTDRG